MTAPTPPSSASLAGKKILVMGLGRFGGGVGVAKWLVAQGAKVTVNDEQPAEKLTDSLQQLDGLPIDFKLGGHRLEDFLAADLLVINPAVDKQKNPVVREALQRAVPYTTEMNLFLERNPAFTIGITGSVGKSTTTSLIFEALRAGQNNCQFPIANCQSEISPSDRQSAIGNRQSPSANSGLRTQVCPSVFLGGNIGKSLLLDLPDIHPTDFVVLELSSFMLEDTPLIRWSPDIAVVTNLFPNHLDRHDTLENYALAKQNILKFQTASDIAIFNRDDPAVSQWSSLAKGQIAYYTTRGPEALPLAIPGEHNQSNAQAALAVLAALEARGMALDRAAAIRAIKEFPGLSHRLQLVHALALAPGGQPARTVRFYNDSKATTPEASITALHAFPPRSAIFLVGGYDKHIDMSAFEELLARHAGGVIGLGQTGQAIIDRVRDRNPAAGLPPDRLAYAGTLESALPLAHRWAFASPDLAAVVLSPASASWGQFPNYEKRGETFILLSRGLPSAPVSPP